MKKSKLIIGVALVAYLVGWGWFCISLIRTAGALAEAAQIKTIGWVEKAADAGNTNAQLQFGSYYLHGYDSKRYGQIVKQNNVMAYLFYSLAANSGNITAKNILPIMQANMTPEQTAEGQKLVNAWKPNLGK